MSNQCVSSIQSLVFGIQYPVFGLWLLVFGIQYPVSSIQFLVFGIQNSTHPRPLSFKKEGSLICPTSVYPVSSFWSLVSSITVSSIQYHSIQYHSIQYPASSITASSIQYPVSSFWSLVFGLWSLVFGGWSLASSIQYPAPRQSTSYSVISLALIFLIFPFSDRTRNPSV